MIQANQGFISYKNVQQTNEILVDRAEIRRKNNDAVYNELRTCFGIEQAHIMNAIPSKKQPIAIVPTQIVVPSLDFYVRKAIGELLGYDVSSIEYAGDKFDPNNEEKVSYTSPSYIGGEGVSLVGDIKELKKRPPLRNLNIEKENGKLSYKSLIGEEIDQPFSSLHDFYQKIQKAYGISVLGDRTKIFGNILLQNLQLSTAPNRLSFTELKEGERYPKKRIRNQNEQVYVFAGEKKTEKKKPEEFIHNIDNLRIDAAVYYKTIYPLVTNEGYIPLERGMDKLNFLVTQETTGPLGKFIDHTKGKLFFNCIDIPIQYFIGIAPKKMTNTMKQAIAGKNTDRCGPIDEVRMEAMTLVPKNQVAEIELKIAKIIG